MMNLVSKSTGDARNAGVVINAVYPDGSAYVGKKHPAESYYKQTGGRCDGEYVYNSTNVTVREVSVGYAFDVKHFYNQSCH
jgi:hypothetical protein